MGLDITAYKNVKLIDTSDTTDGWEEKHDWSETVYAYPAYVNDEDFPGRAKPLVAGGVYEFEEKFEFRAGSYGGYGRWRNLLSELALGVNAGTVWANEELYKDKPFYELIAFSDCEGIIGSEAAGRLYKAFKDNAGLMDEEDLYDRQLYEFWALAFKMAAQNGFVHFW